MNNNEEIVTSKQSDLLHTHSLITLHLQLTQLALKFKFTIREEIIKETERERERGVYLLSTTQFKKGNVTTKSEKRCGLC